MPDNSRGVLVDWADIILNVIRDTKQQEQKKCKVPFLLFNLAYNMVILLAIISNLDKIPTWYYELRKYSLVSIMGKSFFKHTFLACLYRGGQISDMVLLS